MKEKKPAKGGLAVAAKAEKTKKAPKEPKQSKCAYIDDLLESGKHTIAEIVELTCEKFPKANKKSTLSTVRARPAHMKKAGRVAKWKPEPEAAPALDKAA